MTSLPAQIEARFDRYRLAGRWTLAGAGAAMITVLLAGVLPTVARLKLVSDQVVAQRETRAQLTVTRKTLPQTSVEVDRLERTTAALHSAMPAEQQVASLVSDVKRLARDARLGDLGWTPGEAPLRTRSLSLLPVRLHVAGEYPGMVKFMTALQALPRPIRLRDLDMTSDLPGSGRVDVRLTIDLVTAGAI